MKDIEKHLSDISEMRNIMDRSTRFISLSGASGIAAGTFAILGAIAGNVLLRSARGQSTAGRFLDSEYASGSLLGIDNVLALQLSGIALLVLACALVSSILLTYRKAKKNNDKLFNKASQRMLINMAIPLVSGGLFCLVLMYYSLYYFVAPCTLIFYGLACVSASQHTLTEVRYIGLLNIVLGFINCFFLGYGLIFWALGFGVLHILYGVLMYNRHDRPKQA